jgi:prolyl 4-hydroxylase
MAADGSPNHDTIHAALPVVKGVKYVVTRWYRERRWEPRNKP